MIGDEKTKRSPSRAAPKDAVARSLASMAGTSRIITSAASTNRNETALNKYAQPTPSEAITSPPIDGPSTDAD